MSEPGAGGQTSSPPPAPDPSTETTAAPPPETTTSSAPPPPETSTSVPPTSRTTNRPPETTTTTSSSELTTIPSSTSEETSSEQTTTDSQTSAPESTTITTVSTNSDGSTSVLVITRTRDPPTSATDPGASQTSGAPPLSTGKSGSGGLSKGSTVAIGVVVPIAAIAILAIVGLYFWKKRRARMQAEEERRKEVEDYSYNPNADPTIPSVGLMTENGYDMRDEGSSGYRGWGTTLAGSTGRKASTTVSGGQPYSDAPSPRGTGSEARSNEPLMDSPHSEGEILGAMGPSAANNRGGDVHRGPSNASSAYSAAGRSDGSDGAVGMAYGSGPGYYDQYGQNPYSDNPYGSSPPQDAGGAPIIRDNPARRNTRIESPSHFPQGSVGISQNF